jgi:ABC-type Fe3+-hydroxamate transport system substrate-binding protein
MTKVIINEGLDYHDLEGIVLPVVSVDEYSAQMGKDSEIVTIAFTVKNKKAGEDLADWFERGYDFVLDAQVSDGELSTGKYLVFVEMNRRTSVPERIVTLLDDLETLTDMKLKDWTVIVDEEEYEADKDILKQVITMSPHKYREQNEDETELNEMRQNAGLETVSVYPEQDSEIKAFKAMAGL